MGSPLSKLPSVSKLLADPRLSGMPHAVSVEAARGVVDETRQQLLDGGALPDDLTDRVVARAQGLLRQDLRGVINATGIPIHTNLGRAPLCAEAVQAVADVARGYANVEMLLGTGERGGRLAPIQRALLGLTGAESSVVVNNNAAAVLLALTALARGREVIVSRGELVEIGGSFRVPDVIESGGARLVDVGTTNRTRTADYARAIGPDTAVILRVHRSNFRIEGFTERPLRTELVALAEEHDLVYVEDCGSGLFSPSFPLAGADADDLEPIDEIVAQGAHLVCSSGDKLLGGPQAGIAVGRADVVSQLRKHPLYRALRLDKLGLAALEATLLVYRQGRPDDIPVRHMIQRDADEIRKAAQRIAAAVPGAEVRDDVGFSGGGALPGTGLSTTVVALDRDDADVLARALRTGAPPIVARVHRGALLIDPRCLLEGEEQALIGRLQAVLDKGD